MKKLLLLGAGFSRNWGGWLADELAGDLLARLQNTPNLVRLLYEKPFETVIADLQRAQGLGVAEQQALNQFQDAVKASFREMNHHFSNLGDLRFSNEVKFSVDEFLSRFDTIYTLNQDCLLEAKYKPPVALHQRPVDYPGLDIHKLSIGDPIGRSLGNCTPKAVTDFVVQKNTQPIFKLHGSIHWFRSSVYNELLVLGGGKKEYIDKEPLLRWYHEHFKEDLMTEPAHLMIIGYSFQDAHINAVLSEASLQFGLKTYIVDPAGFDVVKKRNIDASPVVDGAAGSKPSDLFAALNIIGLSQRPLSTIFKDDALEHAKLMRFF